MKTTPSIDQTWYERFYGETPQTDLIVAPEIVQRYATLRHAGLFHLERVHERVGDVRGKRCLCLGCGTETSTVLFALKGAEMWALDLAVEALRRQRLMAQANGTDVRTHHVASSCDALPFPDDSFDVVIGIGILHHLQDDLDTPTSEVARVLKKDGHAVFEEPIARSRLLWRLRTWMPVPWPVDSSPQCRPLRASALDCLAKHFHVEADPFHFLGRLNRLLLPGRPFEFAPRWKKWMLYAVHYLDHLLLRLPGLASLGSVVVLDLRPVRSHLARLRCDALGADSTA